MPTDQTRLTIEADWRGQPVPEAERVHLSLGWNTSALELRVDAPFWGNPVPDAPAGRCEQLWEHEVVELFLLGSAARYTEIELGPHGHFLVLSLAGVRKVRDATLAIEYTATRSEGRWTGRASIDRALLPDPILAANAYAIHGTGAARRYLALHPVPGEAPDFHRLDCFRPLS